MKKVNGFYVVRVINIIDLSFDDEVFDNCQLAWFKYLALNNRATQSVHLLSFEVDEAITLDEAKLLDYSLNPTLVVYEL